VFPLVTGLALWGGLIIGAVYMLRAVRVVLHGPAPANGSKVTNVADANFWRRVPYALLLASLLVFGFFPRLLTEKIKPVTEQIVNLVKPGGQTAVASTE
jgi:NADH:ubiquinone oxidoreductase subunit 4 (subunit M)